MTKNILPRNLKASTLFQVYLTLIVLFGSTVNIGFCLWQVQRFSHSEISLDQFFWQTGIIFGITIGFSYLLCTLIFRSLIVKPLQKIQTEATQISNSETFLGQQISEPYGADLRDLARIFNSLSQNLQNYTADIENKVAERTRLLEEASRLVQEVLDTSPNMLSLMNTEIDQFNYVNREYAEFFGVDSEEVISLGPVFIRGKVHPNDQLIYRQHEQKLLSSKDEEVTQSEFRMANYKGEWRWMSARSIVFQRNRENAPKLVLNVGHDINNLKETEEKLRFLSIHDQLTGLYNRLYFEEETARLDRGRIFPISTIMADLDNLKTINDSFGHAQGDEVLKATAQIFRSCFRAEDVVARIGGDEFAALLPGAGTDVACHIIDRIQEKVQTHPLLANNVMISISLGTSTIEKGTPLSEAIKGADERMYEMKQLKKMQLSDPK